jgi:hypothetical protein
LKRRFFLKKNGEINRLSIGHCPKKMERELQQKIGENKGGGGKIARRVGRDTQREESWSENSKQRGVSE